MRLILSTSLAPVIWGTTYIVTTQSLPPDRPFFVSLIRALPIGLLILAFLRQLPQGIWYWRAFVLGALNIGLFFALLFTAAYRLPGGVVAVTNAIQPLLVATLAWILLEERLTRRLIPAACAGIVGVALIFTNSTVRLDFIGMSATLAAVACWSCGTVLTKRWGQPAPLFVFTAWQLIAGGLILLPLAVIIEGLPPALSVKNLLGFAYLGIVGTGLAYALWFRGIARLPVSTMTFLTLLSPVSALLIDFLFLNRMMNAVQAGGVSLVLASIFLTQRANEITDRENFKNEIDKS